MAKENGKVIEQHIERSPFVEKLVSERPVVRITTDDDGNIVVDEEGYHRPCDPKMITYMKKLFSL